MSRIAVVRTADAATMAHGGGMGLSKAETVALLESAQEDGQRRTAADAGPAGPVQTTHILRPRQRVHPRERALAPYTADAYTLGTPFARIRVLVLNDEGTAIGRALSDYFDHECNHPATP